MWKILVADDESMERTVLKEILEEQIPNVQVRTAPDGLAANEICTLWNADLALLDIEMPVMNGIKAAGAIRRNLPDCQIIFLTAYGLFEYAQEALRLGVTDYLLKPAEDEEVVSAVLRAFAKIEAKRAEKAQAQAHLADSTPNSTAPTDATDNAQTTQPPLTATDKPNTSKPLLQMQAYLAANYAQDISLESLAETLDFSPFYLSKLFKQTFGTSFIEYLTDLRVQAAKGYLRSTTKSAKEIGELVGYPNSNYFMKLFKKKTGLTPTEYRNTL